MKKTNLILTICIVYLAACKMETEKPASTLENLKESVLYLASDELMGREIGTEGEKLAAEYIKNEYLEIGLNTAGSEEFFQKFEVTPSMNPHEKPKIGQGGDSLSIEGINVVGKIDNPGDDMIIIGAHYDHLGIGGFGSLHRGDTAIHNGADDNASGVAVMIETARLLKTQNLNKDIVIIAFSGEEKGLWGSNYFVKNPTIDLSKVTAMINLDMVGRLDETKALAIHGTGTSPVWPDLLNNQNLDSIPLTMKASGVGPSDHTSFYLQDIPVLHLFTGQHDDYHKPGDDAEKLNYEGMEKLTELLYRICVSLDSQEKLAFTKTKDESSDTPRFKVTLGVVPDYLFDGEGMRIDGVSPEKPAANAGLKKGDVVIKLGEFDVIDMMTYMKALSKFESGMTTEVTVKRNSEEMTFDLQFL